jgi:hypothetical protein
MVDMPKFHDAPGLKVRARRNGTFTAYWVARHDIVKRGFRLKLLAVWAGVEPTEEDRMIVSERCNVLQGEMMLWDKRDAVVEHPALFDGTVRSLIFCYRTDRHSPFVKLRHGSKMNYGDLMRRIERDHGAEHVRDLKGRDMIDWHEAWTQSGVTMAHSLMRMLRQLLTFGMTILEDDQCTRLSVILSKQRFTMAPARVAFLTAEMANAICELAHDKKMHSIALAQAIQFEGMLRQKDIIGEWVPESEPGPSLAPVWKKQKWQRGIVWSEIDGNILRHVTSKRGKVIEIDLSLAPMVVRELELRRQRLGPPPTFGPVIVNEATGRPWTNHHFREIWRRLADECGIPRNVQQRDSRAGAISEATDAGADLESVRHAATHSNIATTQRYSRNAAEKTATVLKMRVEHRNKGRTS